MADTSGNPWSAITGFIDSAAPNLGGIVGGFAGSASSIGDLTATVGSFVTDISQQIKMLAWLFVPAHWLRILAGIVGVLFLGGSIYLFKEAL